MDPVAWLNSLPSITRVWFVASVAVNLGTSIDFLHAEDLFFDASRLYPKLELWRILTSFLYGGGSIHEFHIVLSFYMISIHSASYEKNPHYTGGNPQSDYAFCLLFCMTTCLLTYVGLEYFYEHFYQQEQPYLYPLFGRTLLTSVIYLWSRRNPNANVHFIVVPVRGALLPFCDLALALAFQNPIYQLLHGMLVAHIYYYLAAIVPTVLGRQVLHTPRILVELLNGIFGEQPEYRQDVLQQQRRQEGRRIRLVRVEGNNNTTRQPSGENTNQTTDDTNEDDRRRYQEEGANDAHIAAKTGHLQPLQQLAQSNPERLTAKDHNHWQPLHEAVRGGHLDIVNLLLSLEEVDKNAQTLHGPNPLWIAEESLGADHPVTKRLIEVGAVKLGPEDRR